MRQNIIKVTVAPKEIEKIDKYVKLGYALSRADVFRQSIKMYLDTIDDGALNEEYDLMIDSTNNDETEKI